MTVLLRAPSSWSFLMTGSMIRRFPLFDHCELSRELPSLHHTLLLHKTPNSVSSEPGAAHPAELTSVFNSDIASLVAEVTDDKSLDKAVRKKLQVEHATTKSKRAKIIKLADKTSNLRSLVKSPPDNWNLQRRREYLDWALAVAVGLRGTNTWLEAQFDEAAEQLAASCAGNSASVACPELTISLFRKRSECRWTAFGGKPPFAAAPMWAECQNRSLRARLGRWARVATTECRVSGRFQGKDKDLAGIYTIWISDPVSVRFVNDRVSRAHAVGDTADAPEAVATRYDRGRNLGLDDR